MKRAILREPPQLPLARRGRASKGARQRGDEAVGHAGPVASGGVPRVDWTRSAAHRMDKSKLPRLGRRQAAALLAASRGDR
jgi:hypothetical protein